jgi:hypothetical protein
MGQVGVELDAESAAGVHEVAQVAAGAGQAQSGDLAEEPRPGVVEVARARAAAAATLASSASVSSP